MPAPDYAIGVVCAGKATQERFCICGKQYPKSDLLMVLFSGGSAMWLVWYVATIGTLSALSLLPSLAPMKAHEDRTPDADM
jgi:hypothetical protein